MHPAALSALVLNALAERNGIDPAVVDDVVWGCVAQAGEQTMDIARNAVLSAGWPLSVPGTTVDRQCGSSQQSVHFAAAGLIAGQYDVVVAGGVESMSRVPMMAVVGESNPFGPALDSRLGGGGAATRGSAPRPSPSAGVCPAPSWTSSRWPRTRRRRRRRTRAGSPARSCRSRSPTAPWSAPTRAFAAAARWSRWPSSRPAFKPDGVIHAGNSSQISDGSAALLMTTSEKAAELGLTPIARVHTAVLAADDPIIMLTAPIPATRKALAKSGLRIDEIGAFEVNEAFAPVPLAWLAEFGADAKALNANGGAIALGHPLGGSGARLMTTLVHHMRDNGIRYGLQTMCEGGGQANATILELL